MLSTHNHTLISKYLAQNLKKLRQKKSWGQQQLAEVAGIPRTTLTHMESGDGNPSLINLNKISQALGVGIEELISKPRSECEHIKAADIEVEYRTNDLVTISKLLPDNIRGLEIDKITIAPYATMGGNPHLRGTREYMHVLKGEIHVFISGDKWIVKKGDVLAFPGNQAHSYRNFSGTKAQFLSVVVPVPATVQRNSDSIS